MVMDGDFQRSWEADERRKSRIVFIGRGLDEPELERGFASCVAG
jgi:G3E family GTPase